MIQTLTAQEIAAKGITKKDIAGMLRRAERLVNWHVTRYTGCGGRISEGQQKEWDAACARWDHIKETMAVMQCAAE